MWKTFTWFNLSKSMAMTLFKVANKSISIDIEFGGILAFLCISAVVVVYGVLLHVKDR